ncbi:lipocalin family protein [Arenicella chitinivorans]|nr:lipocalin family protein [Arenicella chitinivorans]
MKTFIRASSVLILTLLATACATRAPMPTVPTVDLNRFMGDWYVIANIPTFLERDAYNAVESYALDDDGNIPTTFTFNKGAFDGPKKTYRPKGFVRDTQSNAEWGMQFIWPIKADYRIVHLNEDYSQVIIGRNARDYVWLMARTPTIADADYERLVQKIAQFGYDVTKLKKVPQQSLDER